MTAETVIGKRWSVFGIKRILWGSPATLRCALSIGVGVWLGLQVVGTPVWWCGLVLALVLRTHLPCVALGWGAGTLLAPTLAGICEARGAAVLLRDPAGWRALLKKPFICYLDLQRAQTLGRCIVGAYWALGASAASAVLFVLGKKYLVRRSS